MFFAPYRQSLMTWNVVQDSSVTSGRWAKRDVGLWTAFWDDLRESLGTETLSGGDALSVADFMPSGDRLEAREFSLDPLGVFEVLVSSRLIRIPFALNFSSAFPAPLGLGWWLPSSIVRTQVTATTGITVADQRRWFVVRFACAPRKEDREVG